MGLNTLITDMMAMRVTHGLIGYERVGTNVLGRKISPITSRWLYSIGFD